MGSQSEFYYMQLSKKKKKAGLLGKKKTHTHTDTSNNLHGGRQFSYKANEKFVTRPSYSIGLSKTYNMISSFCVCVLLCGINWNYGLNQLVCMRELLFLFIGDFKRKSKIFELWAPGQECITYILSIKKQVS